jgi:hypothetical protein
VGCVGLAHDDVDLADSSCRLWGISCSQAWNYFRDYPKDPLIVKAIVRIRTFYLHGTDNAKVCIGWTADTVHQILISHTRRYSSYEERQPRPNLESGAVYVLLIKDFGNPLALLFIPKCALLSARQ